MIDAKTLNSNTDIRDLARQYSQLEAWTSGGNELAGPCPKCGGTDRLHVKANTWACYQCHPWGTKGGDAIGFVMWAEGKDFRAACEYLAGGNLPGGNLPARPLRTPERKEPKPWRGDGWQLSARADVTAAVNRLHSDAGRAVREYLAGRGLLPATWQAFQLGAAMLHGRGAAVLLPWAIGDRYTAVKYRVLAAQEKGDRFTSRSGGEQTLFGLQCAGNHFDGLVLVEGEFNAMSIWQAVRDLGRGDCIDAVSFGSEKGGLAHDLAVKLAGQYRRVIVWADNGTVAGDLAARIGGAATGIKSPFQQDANDLLQAGKLGEFLRLLLERLNGPAAPIAPEPEPARLWRSVDVTLPAGCGLGLPDGRYEILASGEIRATYTPDELEAALFVARAGMGCNESRLCDAT